MFKLVFLLETNEMHSLNMLFILHLVFFGITKLKIPVILWGRGSQGVTGKFQLREIRDKLGRFLISLI